MEPELYQLGAVAVIFVFAVREFFAYLKAKSDASSHPASGNFNKVILEELQLMNNNHLHSIESAIKEGFSDHTQSEHVDNMQIIQLLGEIKGSLNK